MKINKKNKKGFSIGEVILSVFILSVGLVGTFKLYFDSIKIFADERDTVIASMLAQEGVELIRNVRDNNWADRDRPLKSGTGSSWEETFKNFPFNSGPPVVYTNKDNCKRGYSDTGQITCDQTDFSLNINGSNFYEHGAGTATKFKRRIAIKYDDPVTPKEATVTSLVSWGSSNPSDKNSCSLTTKCVFSESILRDWGTGS